MTLWALRVLENLEKEPKGQLSRWVLELLLSRGKAPFSQVLSFLPSTLGGPCLPRAVGWPMGMLMLFSLW